MADLATTESLGGRASRAFGWSFLNTLVSRLGTLAIGIALARILGPDEFGVFAVAMVTLLAILSFNELGVSLAIVRWPSDPAGIAPTVATISVASSALLTVAMVVAAPAVTPLLGDAAATPVVQVMAVSVLINGVLATPAALLQREFMQKQRMVADQVNAWLGAFVSLACALAGMGAMSLAIGRIAGSGAAALLFLRWSPLPYRFGWDAATARALLAFGLPLAAASVVLFASGYADQMVAGSTLGATALGFYALAFNLASWPVSIFSQPLRSVAPAAFARMQHSAEEMAASFTRVLTLVSAVSLPACLAIAGAAEPVIGFVYGAAWLPAAAALAWLAGHAAMRIWFELSYDFLVVLRRSSTLLMIQLCWFAVSVPAFLLGAHRFGIAGIAAAQVAVAMVVVLPLYLLTLRRNGVAVSRLGRAVVRPVVAGLGTGVAAWAIAQGVESEVAASVLAGLTAVSVIALLLYLSRAQLAHFRGVVGGEP